MSANLVALVAGTVLAVGALAYVLYPLFFNVQEDSRPPVVPDRPSDDSAIVALREIEFDRATGKLSESDYAQLRQAYSAQAIREMRAATGRGDAAPRAAVAAPQDAYDPIEARIRAMRATHRECATCGVRPEPDAVYCSTCGTYLERRCPSCSAEITEPGATFCSHCGTTLVTSRGALAAR